MSDWEAKKREMQAKIAELQAEVDVVEEFKTNEHHIR